jgi:hypothetical protein
MVRIFEFTTLNFILIINIVSQLESLRSAAASEFELRGPFPKEEYGRIMESTNKMLDTFHSINVAIQKDLTASTGEAAILKYTVDERVQLCARISHLFQGMFRDPFLYARW